MTAWTHDRATIGVGATVGSGETVGSSETVGMDVGTLVGPGVGAPFLHSGIGWSYVSGASYQSPVLVALCPQQFMMAFLSSTPLWFCGSLDRQLR